MKQSIHPTWFPESAVTCACGNTFTTGSTLEGITIDICNKCHPFFTGEMRFVDRQGRVDKFMQKMQAAEKKKAALQEKSAKKKATVQAAEEAPRTYQEALKIQQSDLKKQTTKKAA
ncbi:MAG: 50S ribosomal protein L31 [bacterium]|nr:50S ribosomal protein L31 [bacterium]